MEAEAVVAEAVEVARRAAGAGQLVAGVVAVVVVAGAQEAAEGGWFLP